MPGDNDARSAQTSFEPSLAEIKARQMGELTRGGSRWDVLLEIAQDRDIGAARGRIHFISGNIHRLSGWIFLEGSEKDIQDRFSAFSAQDLWNLLHALGA